MKCKICLCWLSFALVFWVPTLSHSQVMFQVGQSLGTSGSQLEVVAAGDVNNDHLMDIIAGTGYYFDDLFDYKLIVYLQSPEGTFPTTQYYPYSNDYPGITSIAVNDINQDTLNDVIIGFGDSIAIFAQDPAGILVPFQSYYSGGDVQDVKVADLNNDHFNDIVVGHASSAYLRVFYQNPTGFTSNLYAKPMSGSDEIEIGDINGDGLNDVVYMVGAFSGGIHVFIQNESGTLNNYTSYFPGGTGLQQLKGIAIGDLNHDGRNDVAASKAGNIPSAGLVIWYQDTTTNKLKEAIIHPAYQTPKALEMADFNCDGWPEIYMTHGGWDAISVWSTNDTGQFSDFDLYSVVVAQHPSPEGLTSGDINNDGKLDIVAVGNFTTIELLLNSSIPSSFIQIDTSLVNDTTTYIHQYESYAVQTFSDSTANYIIVQTDSLLISHTLVQDSIHSEATLFRTGVLCDSLYHDVVMLSDDYVIGLETTDSTFWSSKTDTILLLGQPPGIQDEFKIFPNPFTFELTFKGNTNEHINLFLYDFMGQPILRQTFTGSLTLPASPWPNGIYHYVLYIGERLKKAGVIVKL